MKKIYFKQYYKSKEDKLELISALEKHSIVHYNLCNPKVWNKTSKYVSSKIPCKDIKIWYNYAKRTNYYKEIFNKYMK